MFIAPTNDASGEGALTAEDQVFDSLDHQVVGEGHESWVISVVGVYVQGDAIWVQILKDPPCDDTIIVQMGRDAHPGDVLASLKHADSATSRVVIVRPS